VFVDIAYGGFDQYPVTHRALRREFEVAADDGRHDRKGARVDGALASCRQLPIGSRRPVGLELVIDTLGCTYQGVVEVLMDVTDGAFHIDQCGDLIAEAAE